MQRKLFGRWATLVIPLNDFSVDLSEVKDFCSAVDRRMAFSR